MPVPPLALSSVVTVTVWLVGILALLAIAAYVYAFYHSQSLQEDAAELARRLDFDLSFPDWKGTGPIWRMEGVYEGRRAEILFESAPTGRCVRYRVQLPVSTRRRRLIQDALRELDLGDGLRVSEDGFLEAQIPARSVPPEEAVGRLSELCLVVRQLEADLGEERAGKER